MCKAQSSYLLLSSLISLINDLILLSFHLTLHSTLWVQYCHTLTSRRLPKFSVLYIIHYVTSIPKSGTIIISASSSFIFVMQMSLLFHNFSFSIEDSFFKNIV